MTDTDKFRVEVVIKVAGLMIAAFAIFKYFNDLTVARENSQVARALGYVTEFRSEDSIDRRTTLANFWLSNSQLAQAVSQQELSLENYRNLFLAVISSEANAEPFWRAVLHHNQFFEELVLCYEQELCSQETVEAFFCGHVQSFAVVYRPATETLSERLGNSDFGQGVRRLARRCRE